MLLSTTTPAKINLYLDVRGRRKDGYHDIRTVFAALPGLVDTVSLEQVSAAGLSVCCDRPEVPTDERNLCWRAATEYASRVGLVPAWRVAIGKRIPVAAGLGGGSSDAAAALRLLNAGAAGRSLPPLALAELARKLGADVPFFLDPGVRLAEGIGEVLRPVACRSPVPVVLLNGGFPVPASWAYANLRRCGQPEPPALAGLLAGLEQGEIAAVARHCFNALEFAVIDKFPLVELMLEFLRQSGCLAAHVSGSGPTVFGICAELGQAQRLAQRAQRRFGRGTWTCAVLAGP
jgi:4-diphosphocytidyl-2-C-methyl-D-erythritol kinase